MVAFRHIMKLIHKIILALTLFCNISTALNAAEGFISAQKNGAAMVLFDSRFSPSILINASSDKGILRAVGNLKSDFEKVTGFAPQIVNGTSGLKGPLIIVGAVGSNSIIDELIKNKKFNDVSLKGKNEKFIIESISHPFDGVEEALVIAGSDKRGTIYGVYELSQQMGVSPWYYWADVPVAKKQAIYFKKGAYTDGEPAVTYRGIFLNDEAPALSGWSHAVFGGFNSKFYEKVFELLLRLKANFLWPAMWGSAFYDDDPLNGELANEMGIIMGTSHHEPMAMAQQDWHRYVGRNNLSPVWDYVKNADVLRRAWKFGIERSKSWEKVVTVGMRGDGDEAMEEGTNIALLEKIVKEQRKIIEAVTGQKAAKIPQVWALYKEVQDYYDQGMRVPDDVTLLFCDDNWGNVRKLPDINAKPRTGGYGMYYHFDYVGAPRNSKWVNINPIQRVWEQMNLAYAHGVERLWVVNVGDLKPMEFPISFFLDMAWNPARFNAGNLAQYTEGWCTQQFGGKYAREAARLITLYAKYNRRVTPELLDDKTYSMENYNEFETVVKDYRVLLADAMRLYYFMPEEYRDAFDELVLFPIAACSNLYDMYYAVAKNKYCAARNDLQANEWADEAKDCFERDALFASHYNHGIARGKWPHMMDQARIGYSSWQEPRESLMPKVVYVTPAKTLGGRRFVEKDGCVSIEAQNFSRKNSPPSLSWEVIPDFGKTISGITTFPQNVYPKPSDKVYVEYDVEFESSGVFNVQLLLAPTLNFNGNKGLRYAVSFDGEPEQIVNFNGHYRGELGRWQAEHIIKSETKHKIYAPGKQTLRIRFLDPGIVLEKILIDTGGLKPSYLGAPESQGRETASKNN